MDQPSTARPDVDIEEDIIGLMRSYPPLNHSRPFFHFEAHAGQVKFFGNVRTPQECRVLVENVKRILGVKAVDLSQLYDDETVRFSVGHVLPPGVFSTVQFGGVALSGTLAEGVSAQVLIEAVGKLPGVRLVRADLAPASLTSN